MPKPTTRSKRTRRASIDRSATTDIVTQLECAIRRPQATLIGALVGGIVPWFARTLAHEQVPAAWSSGSCGLALVMVAVVLGCALFSAITVYKFGRATFNDSRKALGFVLAIEGVMIVSTGATSAVALAVLIAINALANGSSIALARDATCKRRDADTRRAATRARARTAGAPAQPRTPATPVAAAPRATGPSRSGAQVVKVPRWSVPADVIDAEIVSEEKWLA
ncbi:MAG TPA: hypothetical protein VLE97_09650 [Gaiellaceae bacterium]|nr:hypothetical protein [Gaiellaceae bacterium]